MSYPTPTRRLTATGAFSTQPNAQRFAAMGNIYHNQTPLHNLHPYSEGDFYSNLSRNRQQYPAESQTMNETWHTNGQAVIPNFTVPPGFIDHAQLNQSHLQQQHQWQQIPPVPVMPQPGPAVYSAPSVGLSQFQTQAQPQQPNWDFINDPMPDPYDFSLLRDFDVNTYTSPDFVENLTLPQIQEPNKEKSHTGRSVEFPVDLTSSPSPVYGASASSSSTEEVGHIYQAPPRSIPESRPQCHASCGLINQLNPNMYASPNFVNLADTKPEQEPEVAKTHTRHPDEYVDLRSSPPPKYTATASSRSVPVQHPRPQNYAARGIINQSEEGLNFFSDFFNHSDMKPEPGSEEPGSEEDEEEEDEEEEDNEEEEEYPTPTVPTSTPPTYTTTTASTPERTEDDAESEVIAALLTMYEGKWQNKTKPAIAAALYKYKRSWAVPVACVLDCLADMAKVNTGEIQLVPNKKRRRSKRRRRDSSSSSSSSSDPDSEEEQDDRQPECSSSSRSSGGGGGKRRRLHSNSPSTSDLDKTVAGSEKTISIRERKEWQRQQNAHRKQHQAKVMEQLYREPYKPTVELRYMDADGRPLDQKEAFKEMSHQFHGKGN